MSEIQAAPSKAFFVGMLVKDIALEDAILDLMDNSLDGMLRSISSTNSDADKPYSGHQIDITFSEDEFKIVDNCGGIPTAIAKEYAFRMGRPSDRDDDFITLGMYGIGMKRAVFKMGSVISVHTKNPDESFKVEIDGAWLADDTNWLLSMDPLAANEQLDTNGTIVSVRNLNAGIKDKLSDSSGFESELYLKISTHYTNIIKKGLAVSLNGKLVTPIDLNFALGKAIEPYFYQEISDDLTIKVTVGISSHSLETDSDDSDESLDQENYIDKKSHAGWTIICNDRVVLYSDRTRLTGWEDTLPRFHYQYNDLIGIVEFISKKASLLPVTTTKRGVDASSDVYLRVKKRMNEGMKKFISYTNKWKNKKADERVTILSDARKVNLLGLQEYVASKPFSSSRDSSGGQFYIPNLQMPASVNSTAKFMRFREEISNIEIVAEYLFEDKKYNPNDVAKECFTILLSEAKEN